jgi:plastocyanin
MQTGQAHHRFAERHACTITFIWSDVRTHTITAREDCSVSGSKKTRMRASAQCTQRDT